MWVKDGGRGGDRSETVLASANQEGACKRASQIRGTATDIIFRFSTKTQEPGQAG